LGPPLELQTSKIPTDKTPHSSI
jgi:nucleoside-diphosphate-sugar epimerase